MKSWFSASLLQSSVSDNGDIIHVFNGKFKRAACIYSFRWYIILCCTTEHVTSSGRVIIFINVRVYFQNQTDSQTKKGLYKWLAFPAEVIWEVTQALIPTPTAAHHNETMEKSKHERGTATVCPANIIRQLSEVLPGSQRWVTMKITLTPAYPV